MDQQGWILWALGILAAFTGAVAMVLWSYILRVQSGIFTYIGNLKKEANDEHAKLWETMTRHNQLTSDKAVDNERRFATKEDFSTLRQHMDSGHAAINGRLDRITALILGRDGKDKGHV